MTEDDDKRDQIVKHIKSIRDFYSSLIIYVIINAVLVGINLLTSPHDLWFYWVTIFWGLALVIQGINIFTARNRWIGDAWEKRKIEEMLKKEKRDPPPPKF